MPTLLWMPSFVVPSFVDRQQCASAAIRFNGHAVRSREGHSSASSIPHIEVTCIAGRAAHRRGRLSTGNQADRQCLHSGRPIDQRKNIIDETGGRIARGMVAGVAPDTRAVGSPVPFLIALEVFGSRIG